MEIPYKFLIERGAIILSNDIENINHPKFFVVIGENSDNIVGFFFINSNINKIISSKQDFLDMQVIIKHEDYPEILKYTSFIDCHRLRHIPKSKLEKQLENKKASYKGKLKQEDIDRIIETLLTSDLFSNVEKKTFFK